MASRFQWLPSCKASQLRSLAIATGIHSSGTKPALISRLTASLSEEKFLPKPNRNGLHILSIDMGIRNLAYCQIHLPKPWFSGSKEPPIIAGWDRLAISSKLLEEPSAAQVKEAFDPATFAQHAYDLIQKLVMSANRIPDHVLIERQRFRSMGGSAVLEWTLRVNMFEAMLYATLKTLKEQGAWNGAVYPVPPSKVAQFWLRDDEVSELGEERKKKNVKGEKIHVVDEMLGKGEDFVLKEGAKEMAERWLGKVSKGRARKVKGELEVEKMGKLDDLADCLLQGLAWVRWEENRRRILEGGPEVLEEERICHPVVRASSST